MDNLIQLFNIYSAQNNTLIIPIMMAISFFAGILSSLSPCTLGILPLIIGYVGGYSKESNHKLLIQMIFFSLGLSSVLSIIGIICAVSGRAFTSVASPIVLLLFASVIVILGLNLLGFIEINFPALVKKMPQNKSGGLFLFPFLIGVFFALAASPCSSPILASIMALATISKNIFFAFSLLFMFALGQCVIIIIIALFTSSVKHFGKLAKYSAILMKICGGILVLAGIYIYYRIFNPLF